MIVSFLNIKGGTGKTTTTINMAGYFASLGKRVLVVDNDPQSNLTQTLFGVETIFNLTLFDVYQNPKVMIDNCAIKYRDNIDIVPNSIISSKLERELSSRMSGETVLVQKIQSSRLCKSYDFIFIDNSPYLGYLTTNALVASDRYNVVVDTSASAMIGVNMVEELVEEIRMSRLNTEIKILGIIKNNFDFRSNYTKSLNEHLNKNEVTFTNYIPTSVKYKESFLENKTIQEYSEKHSEYVAVLGKEMLERICNE